MPEGHLGGVGKGKECPLLPGSTSGPLEVQMDLRTGEVPAETMGKVVARAKTYALCGILGPDAPRWALLPYKEVCTRKVTEIHSVPVEFNSKEVPLVTSKYDDVVGFLLRQREKGNLGRILLGDQKIFQFAVRAWIEGKLKDVIPVPGPLHIHMNILDGIARVWGEVLLWPSACFLGRQGISKISRSFHQLEDLVVIITVACLRALQALRVTEDHIGPQGLDLERMVALYGPEITTIIFFLQQWGMPYIYQRCIPPLPIKAQQTPQTTHRVCGRVGLSIEWTSCLQVWHKPFVMARKCNYAKLIRDWLQILHNPGVTIQDKAWMWSTLFFRTNPHLITCIAGDDSMEHV